MGRIEHNADAPLTHPPSASFQILNQPGTDEHMHRRVGTPGKMHNVHLYVQSVMVMYIVTGTVPNVHAFFKVHLVPAKRCFSAL